MSRISEFFLLQNTRRMKNENVNPVVVATWERNPPHYGIAQLDFTGPSDINTDVVQGSDPLYLFELMFTDELVNHIVSMTNNYATQCIAAPDFKLSVRMKNGRTVSK